AAWNAQCGSEQPTLNGSADLTASPASGSSPLIVLFNAEGIDYNGQTYSVSFGDGESTNTLRDYCAAITASGCSFYHTYKSSGTYTAILKDAGGNTLATQTVTVTGNPTATNFSVSPASGSAPLAVHFSALNVWTPVVDSVATVDFGDGSSGTLGLASQTTCAAAGAAIAGACTYSTTHTYAAAGTYTAILKDAGGNTLATQTVTVTGGNQATAMQIQSIVALLKAFSATSGTIADVQAALGGQAGAQTSTPVTARQAQSIISLLRAWGIDTGVTNTVSSILGGG
ncbi:MAG: hypothetical protein KGI03_03115, partial [Patescibacteria group bacterium]|nr:hypothetical protein [Patescibacteria group bacterium]